MTELLRISKLGVSLPTGPSAQVQAVRDVSLVVHNGQRVGLVGESGSGKSVTGRSISGLLPESPRVALSGSLQINGREMVGAPKEAWHQIRAQTVSMIFQDPLSSLNPTMKVGRQVREACRGDQSAKSDALAFMRLAGLPDPEDIYARYPFELSGGLRQRVLIAIAIAKRPQLIIADEPTTALDVTVQAKVLQTLQDTVEQMDTALIMISHDLGVVAKLCDYIYVMQKGVVVEHGPTLDIFTAPQHPYTQQLIAGARDLLSVADAPL